MEAVKKLSHSIHTTGAGERVTKGSWTGDERNGPFQMHVFPFYFNFPVPVFW